MADTTPDWDLYEAGKRYNAKLTPNYYDTVDANLAFFQGDQWRNLPDTNMPKPVFNIIKRVITFFVASMTTSKNKVHYEPLGYADNIPDMGGINPVDVANNQTETLMDKFKMDYKQRDALFDAAITGDACAHFYFDMEKRAYNGGQDVQGEIEMEMVDGNNVFLGNANNPRIDKKQPYVIIAGRDMVSSLKAEAQLYSQNAGNADGIESDVDYGYQSGDAGKIEVEADAHGKAQYIIVYRYDPKTKTIKASKSVKNAYIYKDVDTGLYCYPVAWMNWEKQKNQYHGRALCTGMLPNQIFINRMFAMVMYHLMMTAFPKAVYNSDFLTSWNNLVGEAIPISGLGSEIPIKNIAGYLDVGNMSNQIVQVLELAMQYTKETLGVSDAAMGNVDPKNTSAIIAVQKSSAIPLENPKANLNEWIEDIGKILLDMIGTYYGPRPVKIVSNGQEQAVPFDFSVLKDMWLDVKADVGESSYWSEIASVQTLDNLLSQGMIDIVDYLERVPDEYIPQKQELIQSIQLRMQQAQAQAEAQARTQAEAAALNKPDPLMQQQQTEQQFMQQAALKQMDIDGKVQIAGMKQK